MATENKDFRVKHGIVVNEGGTFGGPISAGDPTDASHLVTKSYLELFGGSGLSVEVSDVEPLSPEQGMLWLDTSINRLKFYTDKWILLANYDDTLIVQNHTHDEFGFIQDTFVDAGTPSSTVLKEADGQFVSTTDWDTTYSGGILA